MHDAVKDNIEKRARRVIAALKANNMEGWYLPDAAGVREFVEKLIPEGATVANGGSMTLAETGVMDLLASGRYEFLDRTGLAGEELGRLYRRVFSADWYLASANAITRRAKSTTWTATPTGWRPSPSGPRTCCWWWAATRS